MDKRSKSIGNPFTNRSGPSKKKQPTQNYAHHNTSNSTIPRLNSDQHQHQSSTYVPNITQADIHRDYHQNSTYQNNQNDQNIPNNNLYNINDEHIQQNNNTIPRSSTTSHQHSKLPTILQHKPLMSPAIAYHPEVDTLRIEINQLKLIITRKDDKIHDLISEVTILKDQNVQFQNIFKHLENFDEDQSSKGPFAISKLFSQMKLMERTSKDDLKKKQVLQNELVSNNELDRIPPQHEFINGVPKFVVDCILALESNNLFMKTDGLYRESGKRFDIDNNNYNKIHDQKDPHNISHVLKLFLSELETPLISLKQLQEGIPSLNAFDDDTIDAKICKIQKLYHSLPDVNRETLKYLIQHLEKVADIHENNMGSEDLAIIFGELIFNEITKSLNSKDDMDLLLNSTAIPNLCVRIMIENYEEIFEKKYLGMDDDETDDNDQDSTDDDEDNTYKNYDVDHYDEKFGTLI